MHFLTNSADVANTCAGVKNVCNYELPLLVGSSARGTLTPIGISRVSGSWGSFSVSRWRLHCPGQVSGLAEKLKRMKGSDLD